MYLIVINKNKLTIAWGMSADCTDLWGRELHRQVGIGIAVMSGRLHGVTVAHWPGIPPEMWIWFPHYAQSVQFSTPARSPKVADRRSTHSAISPSYGKM